MFYNPKVSLGKSVFLQTALKHRKIVATKCRRLTIYLILSSLPGILKWMGLMNSRQKCLPNWLIYRDCKFRSEVSTIIKAKQVNQKMFRQLLYRTFSLNMPHPRERERAQLFGICFKKAHCIYTICASSGFLSTITSLNSRRWCFLDWQTSKSCKLHLCLLFLYMLGN